MMAALVLTACGADTADEVEQAVEEVVAEIEQAVTEAAPTIEAAATQVVEVVEEAATEVAAEPTAEPTEEPVVEEEMGMDLSGTEIAFWHVWGTGQPAEGMTAIIEEFNNTNEWGITVVGVDQGRQSDLETAINAAVASGDLPNVAPAFANSLANWYGIGVVKPVNEYLDDPNVWLDGRRTGCYLSWIVWPGNAIRWHPGGYAYPPIGQCPVLQQDLG
jgi:ABC-type glycerol-3-phosphate transport system substrate-binding protein